MQFNILLFAFRRLRLRALFTTSNNPATMPHPFLQSATKRQTALKPALLPGKDRFILFHLVIVGGCGGAYTITFL